MMDDNTARVVISLGLLAFTITALVLGWYIGWPVGSAILFVLVQM